MNENNYETAKKTYVKYYTNALKLISTAPRFDVFANISNPSINIMQEEEDCDTFENMDSNCGLPDGELETRKVSELTYDERFNFMKELVAAAENYRKAIIKFSENPHRELADSALDMFDMTMMCFITQVIVNPQLSQPSEDKKDFYKKNLKILMSNFK
jgi:hypothetical protein